MPTIGGWGRRSRALAGAAAATGLLAGVAGVWLWGFPPARTVTGSTFSVLAARARPAVATVYATIPGRIEVGTSGPVVTPAEQGIGSGILVDRTGLVLTNDHVVSGASSVQVSLGGTSKKVDANIVGTDYALDLALLRVPAPHGAAPLALAARATAAVGSWVEAIGNPEGLISTVTVGVVSAHHRAFTIGGRRYRDLLQTDAPINPGNSGGPLVDLGGRVVGVNTAVVSGAYGLGFAIPATAVAREMPLLMRQHAKATGWLGVDVTTLTPALRAQAASTAARGVLVVAVLPGSPAQAAGIRAGDVIEAFDGRPVTSAQALVRIVSGQRARARVAVDVARGTVRLELRGVLGQVPTKAA